MLKEFLQEEGNRTCADCQTKGPRWASVNLGVFMCLEVCARPRVALERQHGCATRLGGTDRGVDRPAGGTWWQNSWLTPAPLPCVPAARSPLLRAPRPFPALQCAGVHRNMGVHISKVRSTDMDKWLPEQMLFIQAVGNTKANRYWEARYTGPKPRQCDKKFIEASRVSPQQARQLPVLLGQPSRAAIAAARRTNTSSKSTSTRAPRPPCSRTSRRGSWAPPTWQCPLWRPPPLPRWPPWQPRPLRWTCSASMRPRPSRPAAPPQRPRRCDLGCVHGRPHTTVD